MQNRRNQNAPPQQQRQRVKLKAKDSKEKLKTYDKPAVIRKPQPARRLEQTKDVVGGYRKDKSKSKGSSSKGPAAALPSALKASQKGSKHGKPPSHKQRKQHSGKKADFNVYGPENGISRRYLKSQEPSQISLITLTNRVKRREERTKGREKSWEEGNKPGSNARRKAQKKAEDNYKEVFPEVKLDLNITAQTAHSQGGSSDEADLVTQGSTIMSPYITAPTMSDSPEMEKNWSKEAMRKSATGKPYQSYKPKQRYFPVNDPSLLSLACTQRLSEMLAPTPKSQTSRILSLKQELPPRSQFIAMPDRLPTTGLPRIQNRDNDGNPIVNGVPFWVEELPEDPTDEGNVLNAAVILDVVSGKLTLVNMPEEQIDLDRYGDWQTLRSRDATCFNKDVLFGNTIRSMVNLFEGSLQEKNQQPRKIPQTKFPPSLITIVDPKTVVYYMRNDLGYLTEVDFVASSKKKEPRSCEQSY